MISVIIPTYHDWGRLMRCLQALGNQTLGRSEFEIIVVNNDPSDPPPASFAPPANTVLLSESAPGSYAARNCGINEARGNILAFTDSDCIPQPHWLESANERFACQAGIARLCGPIELLFSGHRLTPAETYERVKAFAQRRNAEKGTALTANMFARREVFDRVGLFDNSRTSGGDLEWGYRAQGAGFPIAFEPNAVVRHSARTRLKELEHKFRRVASKDFRELQSILPGRRYIHLFWRLRPRVTAFPQYLRRSSRIRHACIAFLVGWWLSFVRVHEVVRLMHGASPRN